MGPYNSNRFLIVEARGFGTAEIAAFNWNEYIILLNSRGGHIELTLSILQSLLFGFSRGIQK